MVLHAEHGGGNNSAFTIHVVSSSDTDTYSAVAAAVGSLKGAKHGGANIKVREMIEDFKANVGDWKDEEEISTYIEKIVRKEAYDKSGLVYGMGHAVYTYSDPRAVLLKEKARILAQEKGLLEEFELYHMIERLSPAVIGRLKGVDKVICANVDFYSGFVYAMLGIPQDLYTPILPLQGSPDGVLIGSRRSSTAEESCVPLISISEPYNGNIFPYMSGCKKRPEESGRF